MFPAVRRNDLAEAAVGALVEAVALTPTPGLTDSRSPGPGASDAATARWAAKALHPGLAAMAAAAGRTGSATGGLREELGAIGRATERSARRAACGAVQHRGAIWALGLLVSAAALEPGARAAEVTATARSLALFRDRKAPRVPSPGSSVAARYGAAGAKGEARAGFPHARRALETLRGTRGRGTGEEDARLNALLGVMSTLQDTGLLHAAGPHGLRRVQGGARAVLEAGGAGAARGREALRTLDEELRSHGLRAGGSEPLFAAALFLDRIC
ncbi:triphosphoribosyl-dephospho-CoA synthase [Streptomyces sp. NBC_01102]|uniref:triphosphoribosyl-dephospho-CoA synthase n=1 Tax=unclassified Streptomyces TaxID=2593676 RepID=UPI00386FA634|nr:triphosphoribosyl-dephospho-CoA synthase [Streptomyces sp. NBC_01102]